MPFLTRKTGVPAANTFLQGLGENSGTAWEEDKYRPSNSAVGLGGLALPAVRQVQKGRLCGNPECMSGWTMPWRNRRRPIFEAQWGCSGRCVLAMVQAAVRRELGDGTASSATPHRHRLPLGLLMLAQGWITHPQLQKALAAQRMAYQRMWPGGGADRAWLEHAMGMSGADDGGIFSAAYGFGDAESIC